MINEALQWAVLVAVLLLCLGLYRQLALYLGDPRAGSLEALAGPRINHPLPRNAHQLIRPLIGSTDSIVVFVTEGCHGCHRLLRELTEAASVSAIQEETGARIVVIALHPSEPFQELLKTLKTPTVADPGELWTTCNVQATPFMLFVDSQSVVRAKEVGHDVASFARACVVHGRD